WFQFFGFFVGTSVFHFDLTLCIAECNLENVAGPAPASQSGLHELTYGYRSNVAAVGESRCYGNGVNFPHTATHTHTASRDDRRPHDRRVPRRSPELARRRRNLGDISSPPVCWA